MLCHTLCPTLHHMSCYTTCKSLDTTNWTVKHNIRFPHTRDHWTSDMISKKLKLNSCQCHHHPHHHTIILHSTLFRIQGMARKVYTIYFVLSVTLCSPVHWWCYLEHSTLHTALYSVIYNTQCSTIDCDRMREIEMTNSKNNGIGLKEIEFGFIEQIFQFKWRLSLVQSWLPERILRSLWEGRRLVTSPRRERRG